MNGVTPRCNAIIEQTAGEYGFVPVLCTQVVGVRGYWARTEPWEPSGHYVSYCSIPGHRENVRRRFVEVDPPEPKWDLPVDHPADATVETEYATYWTQGRATA